MTVSDHASALNPPSPRGVSIANKAGAGLPAEGRSAGGDFAGLRNIVRDRGLYEPQPGYLALKVAVVLIMLTINIAILFLFDQVWVQLLNAAFMAITFTQIGLVGHDVGHKQTLRRGWLNDALGLIMGNLLLGISRDWWVTKHNMHHSHPNEEDVDPDLAIPFIAFSEDAARNQNAFGRFVVRYQSVLFVPMFALESVALHYEGFRHVLTKPAKHRVAEAVLLVAHFVWYIGLIVLALGPAFGLVFIIVHQMLFGLYMSSIFAPNHKGMPLWDSAGPPDFLRQQVLTARNVEGGRFVDWWYGGLNYQIEHHLFPTMPRNRLGEAQPLVKEYCAARGISYHETSAMQSYREILSNLAEVSATVRQPAH